MVSIQHIPSRSFVLVIDLVWINRSQIPIVLHAMAHSSRRSALDNLVKRSF